MKIVYTAEGKIDLFASYADEREAERIAWEKAEAERTRPIKCEICGNDDMACMVSNVDFPLCWRCVSEGRRRMPWMMFSGDQRSDALIDDLAAVVGLLWRETRGGRDRV